MRSQLPRVITTPAWKVAVTLRTRVISNGGVWSGDTVNDRCADAGPPCRALPRGAWPKYAHSVRSGFPRWWRLGLAITEVVLAAGLIVAAVTEGGWYWWAGAIAAATLNQPVRVLAHRA